jgi:hypothetical protein
VPIVSAIVAWPSAYDADDIVRGAEVAIIGVQ